MFGKFLGGLSMNGQINILDNALQQLGAATETFYEKLVQYDDHNF